MTEVDYDQLARALLRVGLAEAVALALSAQKHPEWADKLSNPYGSERAFLDAARRGDFKTFRRSRRITARWADVAAAIERSKGAQRRATGVDQGEPTIDIGRLLEESRPQGSRVGRHG